MTVFLPIARPSSPQGSENCPLATIRGGSVKRGVAMMNFQVDAAVPRARAEQDVPVPAVPRDGAITAGLRWVGRHSSRIAGRIGPSLRHTGLSAD